MKNIFYTIIITGLCFLIQFPLQGQETQTSQFADPFSKNTGYGNKNTTSDNEDDPVLRSASRGPGIGEDAVPISDGVWIILLASIVYIIKINYIRMKPRINKVSPKRMKISGL
jgi:hypothetical protein